MIRKPAILLSLLLAVSLLLAATMPLMAEGTYRGNHSTRIFHHSGCRHFNCKACTIEFKSREEAVGKGFKPCKVCSP